MPVPGVSHTRGPRLGAERIRAFGLAAINRGNLSSEGEPSRARAVGMIADACAYEIHHPSL